MKNGISGKRLLVEILATIFVAEVVVMLLIPLVAPNIEGLLEAVVDSVLLALFAGPIILWRCSLLGVHAMTGRDISRGSTARTALMVTVVLLAGLPASVWLGWELRREIMASARNRFETTVQETRRAVRDWAYRPVYGLKGARGTYAASDSVTRDEFARYVASRDLPGEFPGVSCMGVLERTPGDKSGPAGGWQIRYAEPDGAHAPIAWINLGLRHELASVLQDAVLTGEPRLSPSLEVPLAEGTVHEMLWLVPVYRNGMPAATPEERASALEGVLFATFDPALMTPIVEESMNDVATLEVYCIEAGRTLGLLSAGVSEAGAAWSGGARGELIARGVPLDIGGQRWTLVFRSVPAFEAGIDRVTPLLVMSAGVAITVLLAGFLYALSTSRRRAVRLAREMTDQIRLLSLVARHTTNGVVITNTEQKIEWVNEGFTRISGYTLDEVKGEIPGRVLQFEKTDTQTKEAIREALRAGQGYKGEILNIGKDGCEYWLGVDIQPVRDETGKTTHYIAVQTDLTDIKRAQVELRHAKLAAELANEAKGRFLASMSHEIRTPLNGIIGFSDLLRRGADNGDADLRAEWIGVIHGSGEHLLSLLNDVLDLSKLDAGKAEIMPTPCSPREVISNAVLLLHSRAGEQGIELELSIDQDVPTAIRTDPTRVRQIVMNLVSNAVKFTRQGRVDVAVSHEAQGPRPMLRIEVRDTGVGMTPGQVARLFTPFQQADKTIKDEFGGTGLGLSISRDLARRLGGDITVTSEKGVGSVFTATIEACELLPGESLPNALPNRDSWDTGQPGSARPLEGARVLVADDVEANRTVASLFLQRAGASVVTVEDGQQAVEACRGDEFHLVLMDVQMPVMSGLQATEQIRAAGAAMPILALTAFSSGGDRESCLKAGMNDFLSKPFESSVLVQTAARWFRVFIGGDGSPPDLDEEAFADDAELVVIALDWLSELGRKLEIAGAALDAGDLELIARIGHAIKGSGGTLGMSAFTEPGESLEHAATAGDGGRCALLIERLRSLGAEYRVSLEKRAA
ncbi:MAG: response regulator [Phycisphaeraceae bacterium]|nr:MAG: response regulator [Phycisphaeraceae bacterium]